MKNNIKFVYFDAGGVLFRWKESFKVLAEKLGRNKDELLNVYLKHEERGLRGHITTGELWQTISRELKLPVTDDFYFDMVSVRNFIPIRETHNLIKKVLPRYPVGILSNAHHGILSLSIKHGHIPRYDYSVIIESCNIGLIKPDKEIYEHAQTKAGVPHENILFIDDLEINIVAARKLGWQGIVFDTDNPAKSVKEIMKKLDLSDQML